MPYEVKAVSNQDVAGLAERIDEVIYEILKSQSSTVTDMKSFDRTRLDEYNAMLNSYAAWVTNAPAVDLPETHPRTYNITFISESVDIDVENKAVRDLARLYQAAITELTNSQSARQANGLTVHDKRRFDLIMEKVEEFLTNYVDNNMPMDMPESAPSSEMSGPGFTGA